jgi:hypothetical protein
MHFVPLCCTPEEVVELSRAPVICASAVDKYCLTARDTYVSVFVTHPLRCRVWLVPPEAAVVLTK